MAIVDTSILVFIDQLFPFHIVFNDELKITSIGSTLKKITSDLQEDLLFDQFETIRPHYQIWNYQQLESTVGQPIYFKHKTRQKLILRGQITRVPGIQDLAFLGSMWINSVDALREDELKLKDFAVHDPTFDFLHLLKQVEIHSDEMNTLIKNVNESASKLRQSESQYRMIMENASEMIYTITPEGILSSTNTSFEHKIGYSGHELRGRLVYTLMHSDQAHEFKQALEILHTSDKPSVTIETILINQQHKPIWIAQSIQKYLSDHKQNFIVFAIDITAQKQHEQELSDTKQVLESILLEMTDVVYTTTYPDHQITFVTPSVEQLTGYPPNFWLNREEWWKIVLTEPDYPIAYDFSVQLQERGFFEKEHLIITSTGKKKWIRHKGKLVYDTNGNIIRMDCHMTDITSQHKAESALKTEILQQELLIDVAFLFLKSEYLGDDHIIHESLQLLAQFFRSERVYIFDYDFPQNLVNLKFEWCAEGVTKRMFQYDNHGLEGFEKIIEKHRQGKTFSLSDFKTLPETEQLEMLNRYGAHRIKSLITIPINESEKLVGFIGFESSLHTRQYSDSELRLLELFSHMLINTRNRQQWERQLSRQEEKFRNIIANMNLGLLEVDHHDQIIFANQSMLDMSGYTLEELKGKHASKLLTSPEKAQVVYEKKTLRQNGISDSYELEVTTKDGENKFWFISGAPNYDDNGNHIGSIGIHLDITKQKTLEKQLGEAKSFAEAASKAKELFLANMSHEIRTPLHVILGMIRQIGRETPLPGQRQYLKQAESSAAHLLSIVRNILDMAKIESGEMSIQVNPFSIREVCNDLFSVFHAQAEEKNIELKIFVDEKISPILLGDELRIKQVLINIVGNAIKFTDYGHVILSIHQVKAQGDVEDLIITIADTGIGMSESYSQKLFEKFSQEEDSSARNFEGTGLGMAISRDLIDLMKGSITVQSQRGTGTIFTINLSLRQSVNTENNTSVKAHQTPSLKGKLILLVEDHELNRFIVRQSLLPLECEMEEAENGLQAIAKLRKKKFDLILMDIQMPNFDGIETTKFIRENSLSVAPIIALTANAFKHNLEEFIKIGMNDYIIKPFDENDLQKKITEYLLPTHHEIIQTKKTTNKLIPDFSILVSASNQNEQAVSQLKKLFITGIESDLQLIEKCLDDHDIESLKKIVHKIKPGLTIVKLTDIASLCDQIEISDLTENSIFISLTKLLIAQLRQILEYELN